MANPLDGYTARSWSTYIVDITGGMLLPTRPLTVSLLSLEVETDTARRLAEDPGYDPTTMFYYDFEQNAAGHDTYPCGPLCELEAEYEGHPEGKLCFVSYEGMENDPPNYNFFVED